MITDFSELHHSVTKSEISKLTSGRVSCKDSVLLNSIVNNSLPGREVDLDDHLNLAWKFLFYLALDTSEEERSQNLMESVDNQKLFFLAELESLFFVACNLTISHWVHFRQRFVKPFLEFITGREDLWKKEIEECPELTQVIL